MENFSFIPQKEETWVQNTYKVARPGFKMDS